MPVTPVQFQNHLYWFRFQEYNRVQMHESYQNNGMQ